MIDYDYDDYTPVPTIESREHLIEMIGEDAVIQIELDVADLEGRLCRPSKVTPEELDAMSVGDRIEWALGLENPRTRDIDR